MKNHEFDVILYFVGHRMTFEHYHKMDDIHGYLDYLAQTYPQFVQLEDIGTSVEGRPLKVIKISSGVENPKSMWIDGGKCIELLNYLIKYITTRSIEQLMLKYIYSFELW